MVKMIPMNIKGYNSLNIGAGPYEMIPDWLSITIWREKFDDGEIPIKTNIINGAFILSLFWSPI